MEGKIVFTGKSQKGKQIILRYVKQGDAQTMLDYINTLSDERTYIRFQGEHLTLKEEQEYLDSQLKRIKDKKSVHLVALSNNQHIGISSIDLEDRTSSHVGNFGISISKEFRGEGVGKLLMETIVSEAQKELPGLKIITLGCFSNNALAIKMYKEFGFVEYGRLPNGVKLENGFVDHIYMYKNISNQ
ncbi:MAG TPA: GNAT family N-acetyltransferase [Candidatus Saccharimonadales bacterium]|nr:GNAT family N-acetyltransferase [Candidatus Saccharimonadales bacterium]